MQKIRKERTADCVVGGFRSLEGKPLVGSLLLGLYDKEGKLDHIGFTSSLHKKDRPARTKKLKALIKPPGFTGKAPGARSEDRRCSLFTVCSHSPAGAPSPPGY